MKDSSRNRGGMNQTFTSARTLLAMLRLSTALVSVVHIGVQDSQNWLLDPLIFSGSTPLGLCDREGGAMRLMEMSKQSLYDDEYGTRSDIG